LPAVVRARPERQPHHRATEQRDELAAFQVTELYLILSLEPPFDKIGDKNEKKQTSAAKT